MFVFVVNETSALTGLCGDGFALREEDCGCYKFIRGPRVRLKMISCKGICFNVFLIKTIKLLTELYRSNRTNSEYEASS